MGSNKMNVDERIFRYLKKSGMPVTPWLYTLKTTRTMRVLPGWYKRRILAKQIEKVTNWKNFVPRSKGYAKVDEEIIPEIQELVTTCREIVEKVEERRHEKKTYFHNILNDLNWTTIKSYPKLLEFALNRKVIEIGADYLGTIPLLKSLGIYVSEPSDALRGSQLFHFDGADFRQLKFFINIENVDVDTGPFSFLPADVSNNVRLKLRHRRAGGKVSDERVYEHCEKDSLVQLIGPPGTGALVDSTNCMHYGSRARKGTRIVFMAQYTGYPDIKIEKKRLPKLDFLDLAKEVGYVGDMEKMVLGI